MDKLRILLADDHQIMREGLKVLINQQTNMEVIGEADNGRKALTLAKELQPDIVVMDVSMPELNGLKATAQLKKLYPQIKILSLTRHKDASYLQQLLQAGASGYVLKQSASQELIRAIYTLAAGNSYIDPAMTGTVIENFTGRRIHSDTSKEKELTRREEEVLRLIARGFANKEIADQMNISIKTVEAHKANAMRKMDMKGRTDIVRYAMMKGWLENL